MSTGWAQAAWRLARWGLRGCLAAGLPWTQAHAGSLEFCGPEAHLSAAQQDTLFRFSAIVKGELDRSGQRLALVSRSGLDLARYGMRYSHAGIGLLDGGETPWSVRQLYYACDEHRPWIYDQGMSSFVLGTRDPALGYVSVVFLPEAEAIELDGAVHDNRLVLRVLGGAYSANAYAYGTRYQNCNQWVTELLAVAWSGLGFDDAADGPLRVRAQRWLSDQGYEPSRFDVGSRPLMWLGQLVIPWLHEDDHPAADLAQAAYRVSMPASLEAFVHARLPSATRIEFCHTERQIVVRRGWEPLLDGCQAGEGDTVIPLDDEAVASVP